MPYDGEAATPPERKRKEATDAYSVYEEIIKDNIEYDHFVRYGQVDKDRLDESMRRLKTVIIRMGRMGKMRFEKMQKHGGFEITGICDEQPEKLREYAVPTFTDWRMCLEQCEAEAVIVCTVNSAMPSTTRKSPQSLAGSLPIPSSGG